MVRLRRNGHNSENLSSSSAEDSEIERPRRRRTTHQHQQHHIPNPMENPEVLWQMFLEVNKKLWQQIKYCSSFVMTELGGYNAFDKVAQWCARYPNTAVFVIAGVLVMSLPFLIILGFCLGTILMTFTGLLVLEGTLLTVLSMLLFGCLGALAIVLIFFAIVGFAGYFGFARIYDLYGMGRHKTALMNFLQQEQRPHRQSNTNIHNVEN